MKILFKNIPLIILFSLCFFILQSPLAVVASSDIRSAMVKIYTTQVAPDYSNPWRHGEPIQISGSGCVINGNQILTNAHVVSYGRFIQVRLFGKAIRYKAHLVAISHETDLAILTVEDKSFFDDTKELQIGKLPELQEEVLVYGFPEGGDTLSTTKGVVSRVEYTLYAHSYKSFLAMQIDAAVNFGNSGGPVIVNGEVVAVAMQSLPSAENINYSVPAPVIEHFLADLEDGNFDGMPQLSIRLQSLENSSIRKKYGLREGQSGVLIYDIGEGSAARGFVERFDVLLKLDNHNVANDKSVEFRPNERVSGSYYIDQHQIGDEIKMELLRGGAKIKVQFPLARDREYQVPRGQYDSLCSYYIFGGIVFTPLTVKYLETWGEDWYYDAPLNLTHFLIDGYWRENKQEIVTLLKVLPSDVNIGYHDESDEIITRVDGTDIVNFTHFINLIEKGTSLLVEFTVEGGRIIVVSREQALNSKDMLMKEYGVSQVKSLKINSQIM